MLNELLDAVRAHYLARYRKSITSYRTRFERSGVEVLLEMGGERPLVYRYYRVDLASGSVQPPDLTEVNTDTHLHFEQFETQHGGLAVTLSPLVWNGVQLRIQPALASDARIVEWALKWIDPDERAEQDGDGLGAYVHNVTQPTLERDASAFSVDFGSAPVACVLELLETLRACGAEHVELHSRAMLEGE
jgi:hypothetical protein